MTESHDKVSEQNVTPLGQAEIQRRQRARATVMALLLGAFVVLMFGITIVKIKNGG